MYEALGGQNCIEQTLEHIQHMDGYWWQVSSNSLSARFKPCVGSVQTVDISRLRSTLLYNNGSSDSAANAFERPYSLHK